MGSIKVSEKLASEIIKKTENLTFTFEQKVTQEDINRNYISLLYDKAKRSKIVGFRKNKAPLELIENYYRSELTQGAWKLSIRQALYLAEKSTGKYIYLPSRVISKISKVNNEDIYTFKAVLEFYPEINTKKINGCKLTVYNLKITEKDIDGALLHLRLEHSSYKSAPKLIDYNDKIECDIDIINTEKNTTNNFRRSLQIKTNKIFEIVDNEIIEVEGRNINYSFIKDKLLGYKKGDVISLEKTFTIADETINYTFNITILDVLEPKLPEINKNWLKSLGIRPFTIEQLRITLKEQLVKQVELFRQNKINVEIINLLSEINKDIAIPKSLLIESLIGIKPDVFNNNEFYNLNLVDSDLIIQAHKVSISKLLLGFLITKYSINVNEKDIERFRNEISIAGIEQFSDKKSFNKQLEQYILIRQAINVIKDSLIVEEQEVGFKDFLNYANNSVSISNSIENSIFIDKSREETSTDINQEYNIDKKEDDGIDVLIEDKDAIKVIKTKATKSTKPRAKKIKPINKDIVNNSSLKDKNIEVKTTKTRKTVKEKEVKNKKSAVVKTLNETV